MKRVYIVVYLRSGWTSETDEIRGVYSSNKRAQSRLEELGENSHYIVTWEVNGSEVPKVF